MPVSKEILDEIALSPAEYGRIVALLGREPNPVELGMFGALWSEHCGYKHSRPLLGMLPSRSPRVLSRAGAENAGAIDIGHGLAVVFKVESHNHPSAVEPLQGAATGVGGIVRDILAMGARPIALLNSLRFGPPDDPDNRRLLRGVVDGIAWYGNCIGVPDVAGEIGFDESYARNPLVNAMCVGIAKIDDLASAAADTPGHLLLLAGAGAGRDGIHGASGLASRAFADDDSDNQERRPTVQVGNPFLEKTLIEACLEALATGKVHALQDLGAAGLAGAAVESAARGGRGIDLDISRVQRRESGMTGYEVMLSETQERMLLAAAPEHAPDLRAVFQRWDIPCHIIGSVTAEPAARITDGHSVIAAPPIAALTDAPRYRRRSQASSESLRRRLVQLAPIRLPPPEEAGPILLRLLAAPNITSRQPVYRQYDHQVQTNTVIPPGAGDAAVLRVKGTAAGHRPRHRRQRAPVLPAPLPRRPAGGSRSNPQPVLRGRRDPGPDRLPKLRQPGTPRSLLPAGGVHPRHSPGLRILQNPGGQRQCQPLQRKRRRRHFPHAHHRRPRIARGHQPPLRRRLPRPRPGRRPPGRRPPHHRRFRSRRQ